jgi:hypothetical protein
VAECDKVYEIETPKLSLSFRKFEETVHGTDHGTIYNYQGRFGTVIITTASVTESNAINQKNAEVEN